MLGVEVDDDYKRRIDIVRQSLKKHLQRMNAPCRRSDADGWEALGACFSRRFLRVRGRLIVGVHWQPSYARGGPSPGAGAASDSKHRFDWLNHLYLTLSKQASRSCVPYLRAASRSRVRSVW